MIERLTLDQNEPNNSIEKSEQLMLMMIERVADFEEKGLYEEAQNFWQAIYKLQIQLRINPEKMFVLAFTLLSSIPSENGSSNYEKWLEANGLLMLTDPILATRFVLELEVNQQLMLIISEYLRLDLTTLEQAHEVKSSPDAYCKMMALQLVLQIENVAGSKKFEELKAIAALIMEEIETIRIIELYNS